jgi:ankyrin repeat protein
MSTNLIFGFVVYENSQVYRTAAQDSYMDAKFQPAIAAIEAGDVENLRLLVLQDSSLATSRSSKSHPTLLQCLVLSAARSPHKLEMAKVLVDAGAELTGPLVACGSCDNVEVAELLLDAGAPINGAGGWCPLEEALYWNGRRVIELLLRHGASIHNLRIATGLGRLELMKEFFNPDDSLKPTAGRIDWPWRDLSFIEQSNFDDSGKRYLTEKVRSWKNDRQGIINNAFVYACMHGHIDAADFLLARGAEINVIPGGFDYAGTGLHYAAYTGQRHMVDFLISRGADVNVRDQKVNSTPSGWAEAGGHHELQDYLAAKTSH